MGSLRVIILRGMNGSGKSEFAEKKAQEDNWVCVSRNKIRKSLIGENNISKYFSRPYNQCLEDFITTYEMSMIGGYLSAGLNVVIDGTNLKKRDVQKYIPTFLAVKLKPENIHVKEFVSSIEQSRDNLRKKGIETEDKVLQSQYDRLASYKITSEVIKNMMEEEKRNNEWIPLWFAPSFPVEPYPYDPESSLPKAVICDLDGTLAFRDIILEPTPHLRSFYAYHECKTDIANPFVALLLNSLPPEVTILFITGRKEECRQETTDFIKKYIPNHKYKLMMRDYNLDRHNKKDDPDDVVKYRIFNDNVRNKYNVIGVFDDRKRVVALWQALGLNVADMGNLNEYF